MTIAHAARRLIINADDFGADEGTNEGIAQTHAQGVVTATTALVNLQGFADACRIARSLPSLDVGLHFNISWGGPVASHVPSLAPQGAFRGKRGALVALLAGRIPDEELDREIDAQIEAFCVGFGHPPSHVDVHQHLHLAPKLWRRLDARATAAGIPFLRWPRESLPHGLSARLIAGLFARRAAPSRRTTDAFLGLGATGRLTEAGFAALVDRAVPGLTELMVHPGTGAVPCQPDRLAQTRDIERRILIAPAARAALAVRGIALTDFRQEIARITPA